MIERGRELHAAARHVWVRGLGAAGPRRLRCPPTALRLTTSSAVTRPASMAACALARLSNRPRSTSSRSMRMRVAMDSRWVGRARRAARWRVRVPEQVTCSAVISSRLMSRSEAGIPARPEGSEAWHGNIPAVLRRMSSARCASASAGRSRAAEAAERSRARKQAIAIGLSEARGRKKVPRKHVAAQESS